MEAQTNFGLDFIIIDVHIKTISGTKELSKSHFTLISHKVFTKGSVTGRSDYWMRRKVLTILGRLILLAKWIGHILAKWIKWKLNSTLHVKWRYSELFLVQIYPLSNWIRRDTSYLSLFNLNAGKYYLVEYY